MLLILLLLSLLQKDQRPLRLKLAIKTTPHDQTHLHAWWGQDHLHLDRPLYCSNLNRKSSESTHRPSVLIKIITYAMGRTQKIPPSSLHHLRTPQNRCCTRQSWSLWSLGRNYLKRTRKIAASSLHSWSWLKRRVSSELQNFIVGLDLNKRFRIKWTYLSSHICTRLPLGKKRCIWKEYTTLGRIRYKDSKRQEDFLLRGHSILLDFQVNRSLIRSFWSFNSAYRCILASSLTFLCSLRSWIGCDHASVDQES